MKPQDIPNNEVIIVDYKLGNLFSVKHACLQIGLNPIVTSDKQLIETAKAIILPGVGAFGDAMDNLRKLDLIVPLIDKVKQEVPFFGICLGLQLLFTESEEFGIHKGLGIIDGSIKKFPSNYRDCKIKVPQIGWNTIYSNNDNWEKSPLNSLKKNEYMYFVHSYYAFPDKQEEILTLTNYEGMEYCSSIIKNNIFATQFHPEKSAQKGIEIYKNWSEKLIKNII